MRSSDVTPDLLQVVARCRMVGPNIAWLWFDRNAFLRRPVASRMEWATGRSMNQVGHIPGDGGNIVATIQARPRCEQSERIGMARLGKKLFDRRLFDDFSGVHDHDAVA